VSICDGRYFHGGRMPKESLTKIELEKRRITLAQNEDANTEPLSVAIFAEDVMKPSYFLSKVREYHIP
jgi:hypothetical protein